MDTAQWPQVIGVAKQVEEPRPITDQKSPRPQKEQALNCPRCNSTNTKFCYYNNYSLTQPRYFCKTCRRYWTEDGGTLRTVPVGGGSRKNKRSISSSILSQAQSSSKKLLDHATSASVSRTAAPPNPITYDGQDLNLGYSPMTSYDQYNKRLESDDTVHLVRGFVPASSPQTTGASNNVTLNHTPSGVGVGSDDVASLFPSLNINGLGGRTGLFDTGLPQFEEMQQPPTQNPNLMSEVMNTPLFQNLFQNIMNSPDIIQTMINSDPQLREIIDRNPELAHVLNDPSTLRQSLEIARNPELMRQMMRNTDRVTSNIESSPEGFNMLRRMYENVQEPFLNATTMNGVYRNDLGSNPSTGLLDTQGGGQEIDNPMSGAPVPNSNPLPNPWASGATGNAQENATTRSSPAGLESMFDSMPDNASFEEFLQNPAMPQMIQTVLSSPEYMNQVREIIANPDLIRQLTSPETMQQVFPVQETLSQDGQQSTTQEAVPDNRGTVPGGIDNTGLDMLMGMFGGLGIGNPVIPNQSNVLPEELYATQLSQLQEMGFFDMRENINALMATAGNVHAALERLLGNLGR